MFDSNQNRYVSKGIHETIPLEIQLFCWTCLDKKRLSKRIEMDYLQIFEVKKSNNSHQINIVHRQEERYFCDNYQIRLKNQMKEELLKKIWVIDNAREQTMLLPEDY